MNIVLTFEPLTLSHFSTQMARTRMLFVASVVQGTEFLMFLLTSVT